MVFITSKVEKKENERKTQNRAAIFGKFTWQWIRVSFFFCSTKKADTPLSFDEKQTNVVCI